MDDTTYSVNDLFAMTLDELGVMEPGQPISPEDVAPLKARWPSVLADLNARNVGYFDQDEIEVAALLPLAQILAYASMNAFSISDTTKISMLTAVGAKDGDAERTLKDVRRMRTPRQTMRVEIANRPKYWRYGF
jgi:hypothetical protein